MIALTPSEAVMLKRDILAKPDAFNTHLLVAIFLNTYIVS